MEDIRKRWDNADFKSSLLAYLEQGAGTEIPPGYGIHKSISHSIDCLIDQSSFLSGLEQRVGTDSPSKSIN